MREVISDTTQVGLNICAEGLCPCSENICEHLCGARGTELLQYQGHGTFVVPGAQLDCVATAAVLDPVRSAKSFIFLCHDPSLDQSWSILTLIVKSLLFNCDYLTGFCTFRGSNHLNF